MFLDLSVLKDFIEFWMALVFMLIIWIVIIIIKKG